MDDYQQMSSEDESETISLPEDICSKGTTDLTKKLTSIYDVKFPNFSSPHPKIIYEVSDNGSNVTETESISNLDENKLPMKILIDDSGDCTSNNNLKIEEWKDTINVQSIKISEMGDLIRQARASQLEDDEDNEDEVKEINFSDEDDDDNTLEDEEAEDVGSEENAEAEEIEEVEEEEQEDEELEIESENEDSIGDIDSELVIQEKIN